MDPKTLVETKKKLRAIRRLASPVPTRTAEERLVRIEGIASGKITPEEGRNRTSPDLAERLMRGQASRAQGNALDRKKPEVKQADEEEKRRKATGGRDRQERGGLNRSADVNV